jgi:mRNA interferase RelE/StbE
LKSFELRYHPRVREDVAAVPANMRLRLAAAIKARLTRGPRQYGHPLRASLVGCWRLRVGDYRVVYRVEDGEVWVLAVLHRRVVYEDVGSRLDWTP